MASSFRFYLAAALATALTGPGGYSLDAVLGLDGWWTAQTTAIILAAGVLGGPASLALRRTPQALHA